MTKVVTGRLSVYSTGSVYMGESSKISKILNFGNSSFKIFRMPTKMNNFKFKCLIVLRQSENNQRSYYNLPNSAFWG